MIARSISLYLHGLFALVLLLLALTLLLHISVLLGAVIAFADYGRALFYCAFAILVLASGLAKDRNVWSNEFKSCPRWLRIATLIFMIYGMAVALVQVISFKNSGAPEALQLCISSAFLSFEPMSVCILYSLLWTGPVSAPDLLKRIRISFIMLAVWVAIIVAARLGCLPHQSRQE